MHELQFPPTAQFFPTNKAARDSPESRAALFIVHSSSFLLPPKLVPELPVFDLLAFALFNNVP